jgi:hypothetical protein
MLLLVTFPAATTTPLNSLIMFLSVFCPSIAVGASPEDKSLSTCRLFKIEMALDKFSAGRTSMAL